MASNSSEPDPKVINSIVDRLKKQGLFDKFRKECLADVDTKPAYLNLRHRTEVAVARFLSTQTWHPAVNKNQLRDSLRKHINESSMMSSGIDRVVEQVVNPKIYRVFKPQIDRVVCEFLGIDPDERERQLKLKDEEQRRQRMQVECSYLPGGQQQPFPPGTLTPDSSYGVGSSPIIPSLLDIRMPYMSRGNDHIDSPSPGSVTPQMTVASGSTVGGSTSVSGITYPPSAPYGFPAGMQYGYPTQTGVFPGMTQQGMLQYPLGYSATMPPGFVSAIPQYPMQTMATDVTVAPPQVAQPLVAAPIEVSPVVATETKEKDRKHVKKKKPEPLTVEELLNIPLPPKTHAPTKGKDLGKTEKKDEVGRQSPVVTETKDEVKPKRETSLKQAKETKSAVVPVASSVGKLEVEGQDVSSSSNVPETKPKHSEKVDRSKVKVEKIQEKTQSRDGQKRIREMPQQTSKTSDVKKPTDDSSSVSDTNDIKTETVKVEIEEDSKKVSSQTLNESTTTPEGKGREEAKEGDGESKVYHFAWDDIDAGCISDATISSVHTSDLSSFDDGSDMTTRSSDDDLECEVTEDVVKVKEAVEQETDATSTKETGAAPMVIEVPAEVATVAVPRQKPRRLISLQYNYSDSEAEESREERKARIAHEIEERYLRRQQRRAELEAKRKEREDEKAVEREQRRQGRLAVAATAQREDAIRDVKDEKKKVEKKEEAGSGEMKPKKRDQHRTKEKRKEELREQKVKEMRMALRRQRTRNRRYNSDEFTTFFTGNKCMRSNESYTKVADVSGGAYSQRHDVTSPPTPTQDEHFAYTGSHPSDDATHAPSSDQLSIPIYEVTNPLMTGLSIAKFVHMTRSKTKQLTLDTGDGTLEPGMPYSDVSSDALSFSGSSVDSKTHHSPSEGRQDQTSPHAAASTVKGHDKPTGRSDALSRVRRKSSGERQSSDNRQKQCQSSDTSSTTSSVESTKANVQRYAISDLYKPHHSRSRSSRHSSPTPTQREPQVRPSAADPDKGQEKRRAPPIDEVDFGEAAKKSLQKISFGEAERRSKAIRQRFGQPARHEVRRGSSSKSPGDRVERMPAREPTAPSGGTYWSARDEKYRDTLKSSSTHGSWQSTKSSSQDDDDDNSRSMGRSRSQSEWRTEESPAKSDRKKRKKRRRKTGDSSCSGSEEYLKVSRKKRVSQSSSEGDDLFPASSHGARSPGECRTDEEELHLATRREDETSDSDDDRSISDTTADNSQDVKYTSEDLGQHVAENVYMSPLSAQDTSGVNGGEGNVNQAADGSGSVECEMEVTVGSLDSSDTPLSHLQPTSVLETQELQGEIQLEIWQGSSHWNLSVENVGPGPEMAPSVEVVSVQEPVSDITTGDQVEAVTTVPKDDQVFYEETIASCIDRNKGQKRPPSPDSDGGSGPAKRARSDSTGASNEELVVVVETTSAPTPPVESTGGEDGMLSPVTEAVGFHTAPHIENTTPVEPEPRLCEEQCEVISDVEPSESSISHEDEKPSVQVEAATEIHDIVGDASLEVTDTQEDPPDTSTDRHQTPAEMGQTSSSSDSQEISTVTAASDTVEKSSSTPDRTDERVHASKNAVEKSPPTPERTGERVPTPEKSLADQVSATFERSTTIAEGTLPTCSQSPVCVSPDLDETSPELDEILLLDETTPPRVITDVTTEVVSVSASEGEELPPQSPGSVSPCGEEQQQSAAADITEAHPEADVSPSDTSAKDDDRLAPEDPRNEEVVSETIEASPYHNEGKSPFEDMEVSSLHEETEQTAESAGQTAVTVASETSKSEGDGEDVDNEQSKNGAMDKCEQDADGLHGENDSLPDPASPSMKHDSEHGTLQVTDNSVLLDNSVVTSTATLGNRPDSLPGARVTDTGESVAEIMPKDDTQVASCNKDAKHQEQEADHEEEHVIRDDAKPSSSDANSVEGADTSPCPGVSGAESSLDEDVSETSSKGMETSDKKEDTQDVSDTETLTHSVPPDTKRVEAKSAEPKQEDKESGEIGRRKSRRSVAEQQIDADTSDTDPHKSTALPRQRSRDRSHSMSATPRETRGQRAGGTPPEGSTRESRKLRRPSTPPPTRSRQQSAKNTGSGQQPLSSSVGRKPGKVVTPPTKVVTPPKGKKGKAGHIPMTRASRRKSEEASLPIAKRLRH